MIARNLVVLLLLAGLVLAGKNKGGKPRKEEQEDSVKKTHDKHKRDPGAKDSTDVGMPTGVTALENEIKSGKRKFVNDGYPLKSGDIGITSGEVSRYLRLLSSIGITDEIQLKNVFNLLVDLQEVLDEVKQDPTKNKKPYHNEVLLFISLLENEIQIEGFMLGLQRDLLRRTDELTETAHGLEARMCMLELLHLKELVQGACPGNTTALLNAYAWIRKNCGEVFGHTGPVPKKKSK